jgi:hypothetical protein
MLRLAPVLGDFLRHRRAQNENATSGTGPARVPERFSDFATASLVRSGIEDCVLVFIVLSSLSHESFRTLRLPFPPPWRPDTRISNLSAGSPLLPSAVIGSFLSQVNAMHP